ncbi:Fc.00g079910.m01.CDS01 [Cosmosporella sp. VM-42]
MATNNPDWDLDSEIDFHNDLQEVVQSCEDMEIDISMDLSLESESENYEPADLADSQVEQVSSEVSSPEPIHSNVSEGSGTDTIYSNLSGEFKELWQWTHDFLTSSLQINADYDGFSLAETAAKVEFQKGRIEQLIICLETCCQASQSLGRQDMVQLYGNKLQEMKGFHQQAIESLKSFDPAASEREARAKARAERQQLMKQVAHMRIAESVMETNVGFCEWLKEAGEDIPVEDLVSMLGGRRV